MYKGKKPRPKKPRPPRPPRKWVAKPYALSYDRSKYYTANCSCSSYYSDTNGGSYGPFEHLGVMTRMDFDVGTRVERHKRVLANHGDATTTRVRSTYSHSFGGGAVISYSYDQRNAQGGTDTFRGSVSYNGPIVAKLALDYSLPTAPSSYFSSLYPSVKTQFLKGITNANRSVQGGAFLGQLTKTVHEVTHPANGLISAFRGYLGKQLGHIRAYKNKPKLLNSALSSTYLEAQFGWGPTVQDIEDGVSAFKRLKGDDPREFAPVFANASDHLVAEDYFSNVGDFGHFPILRHYISIKTEVAEKLRGTGQLDITPKVGGGQGPSDILGLGLRDFIPTAWELLPWSFLVDYFVDIGGMIDAWIAPTSAMAYASQSLRQKIKTSVYGGLDLANTIALNSGIRYGFTSTTYPSCEVSLDALVRGPMDLTNTFVGPVLRLPTSASKLGNMAALLYFQTSARGLLQSL